MNRNGQPGDVGPGIPAFSLQRRGDSIGAEPNSQAKRRGCDHEGQSSPPTGVFLEFSSTRGFLLWPTHTRFKAGQCLAAPSLHPALWRVKGSTAKNSLHLASVYETQSPARRPHPEPSLTEETRESGPSMARGALPTGRGSSRFNGPPNSGWRARCYGTLLLPAHVKAHRHHASQQRLTHRSRGKLCQS